MLIPRSAFLRPIRHDERGAVAIITGVLLTAILLIAAWAIDEAAWWVHHNHLQTQADAAALAAAHDFQYPCTPGGTMDAQIQTTVNQYDGTGVGDPNGYATPVNTQVWATPTFATTYSNSAHNLFSLLNTSNYENQTVPADSGMTGSPCRDGAIDVKLTETNLPSIFPFTDPLYVDARARVSIENLASVNGGLSPLAEPLPTPKGITAYLIDEGSNDTVLGSVNLAATDTTDSNWTGTVPDSIWATAGLVGPIGMEIATGNTGSGGGPVACTSSTQCFDTGDTPHIGITYTRVWSNSSAPNYPTTAPQADDATVASAATGGCPTTGAFFSNFVSSSTSCNVTLSANLQFGTTATCATADGFTVTPAGGAAVALTNPACSSGTASPNGTWTSGPIAITPNAGSVPLTLAWSDTSGDSKPSWALGGNTSGKCTSAKPCTFSFNVVQRVFSGAFDDQSSTASNSGPILAAALVNASGEIQSFQKTSPPTGATISVSVLSFQNSTQIPSAPIELSFGGNQANGLVSCPSQPAGKPQAEAAIADGCQPPNNKFELDTNFSATPCNPLTDPTNGASLCLPVNSGNGKLDSVLDTAMNARMFCGGVVAGCNNPSCSSYNYWVAPNTVNQVLSQSPADPRILTMIVTDNGALGNGRTQVPIRKLAFFYVTGWAGDPCIGAANRTGSQNANGLPSTGDDSPSPSDPDPTGVLLGHFVAYTVAPGGGTGSGSCSSGTPGQPNTSPGGCIAVLTQ